MALSQKSLFLYGFEVTTSNQYLEFASLNTQTPLTAHVAVLSLGQYSLTGLAAEIARAMGTADPANTYAVTVNRSVAGGLENRVTIGTTGSFVTLFFGTGVRAAASARTLIGFLGSDYTGGVSYTGTFSAGTALVPSLVGYNYLGPEFIRNVFGAVNVSATGEKESVVYNIQQFFEVNFKYEPKAKVLSEWALLMQWVIQQKPLEFTPEVTLPNVLYECTLERSTGDGKGLGYLMREMLPQFPNFYETGIMRFRRKSEFASLI